jgi:hypothetical protein
MREKTLGRPRKRVRGRSRPSARSLRAAPAGADQYIADQLKAIYDAVVEEPFLIGFSSCLTVSTATRKNDSRGQSPRRLGRIAALLKRRAAR